MKVERNKETLEYIKEFLRPYIKIKIKIKKKKKKKNLNYLFL